MKIIKRGTPPGEEVYEITCHNCHTIFEFQRHEAEYHMDQRDGDYLKIACPVCRQDCYTSVYYP